MIVTQRLKKLLQVAKGRGFERMYCVVGSYKFTTYCVFHKIDSVLQQSIGTNYGRQKPYHTQGMWTGHPNTRMVDKKKDIMYSQLFHFDR